MENIQRTERKDRKNSNERRRYSRQALRLQDRVSIFDFNLNSKNKKHKQQQKHEETKRDDKHDDSWNATSVLYYFAFCLILDLAFFRQLFIYLFYILVCVLFSGWYRKRVAEATRQQTG